MKITDLQPDRQNTNRGSKRGAIAITESLKRYGAGRSIVLDKNGAVIAGNQTVKNAQAAGIKDVQVVKSDGTKLIAVQRTDLDINDPKARELAIADNRTGELSLTWDGPALADMADELELQPFFAAHELAEIIGTSEPCANDAAAEYSGMPEYTSDDQTGVRQIIVHFKTHEDVEKFGEVIGQRIRPKSPSIWFPEVPWLDQSSHKYVED
jgi:sporulation protein YlmC with PRC-barrel domain